MLNSRFVAAAVISVLSQVLPASAQSSIMAVPAEIPAASYSGSQYVDSKGCVFIRANMAGTYSWVPRLTRDRQQLCGFQPTGGATRSIEAANAAAAASAEVLTLDLDTPTPAAPPAPVQVQVQAPAPVRTASTSVGDPIRTVASMTSRPATPPVAVSVTVPSVTPQIVVAPEPQRMTLSEICEGRTGIQRSYLNAETGQPVDCGPAPVAVTVATVAPAPVANGCDTSAHMNSRYAVRCGPQTQPIRAGGATVPASNPVLEFNRTPPSVSTVSVAPTVVAPAVTVAPTVTVTAPVVVAPTQAAPAASSCSGFDDVSSRYMAGSVRCGPQTLSPSGGSSLSYKTSGLFGTDIPASNPTSGTYRVGDHPAGYETAWDDGRLNPNRGIPAATAQVVISTRTAPVAAPAVVATSHRFVQVGTYAVAANAQAAMARLQSMGYPVSNGTVRSNGKNMTVVAAGPFSNAAALRGALQSVRAAGYADAFTRG
ncbi:SPOR domain-containing protein [Marivivens aquimaris]|uniref:SPOR domain-containing protein n=1 Tax=Marivivens aquimaris TaxID=2774876 RepID=UPI001880A211|nr:SPOR domain-containing protein [Marivivens aquimaris]